MPNIQLVCQFLDQFAPTRLAEDWDNVGLLVGDPDHEPQRVMTCLTVTPESANEAIERNVDLIVSHHPLPFRPLKRITTEAVPSKMLWDLIRAGVSIYSPHTGFDSASEGINQSLAQRFQLTEIQPIHPIPDDLDGLGAGRIGNLDSSPTLERFCQLVKESFDLSVLQISGKLNQPIRRVAVACGSGGSFLERARRAGCDTFVTGETTFHTALEAKANGISLVLLGHYTSERFAVETLAGVLGDQFNGLDVWASEAEADPLEFV